MKSILPDALSRAVYVGGRRHVLRPTVANVLRALDDLTDDGLTELDRARLACWRLYRFPRPKDAFAGLDAAFGVLNEPSPYRAIDDAQTVSLTQDAALICAAFRQQYGIDLSRESRRMDWRTFSALLSGITDQTALGSVMSLRALKPPARDGHNDEYADDVARRKSAYAIREHADPTYRDGLRAMAAALTALGSDPTSTERSPQK